MKMDKIDSIFLNYKAHALAGLLANPKTNIENIGISQRLKLLEIATDLADLFAESDEPYLNIEGQDCYNPFPFNR